MRKRKISILVLLVMVLLVSGCTQINKTNIGAASGMNSTNATENKMVLNIRVNDFNQAIYETDLSFKYEPGSQIESIQLFDGTIVEGARLIDGDMISEGPVYIKIKDRNNSMDLKIIWKNQEIFGEKVLVRIILSNSSEFPKKLKVNGLSAENGGKIKMNIEGDLI